MDLIIYSLIKKTKSNLSLKHGDLLKDIANEIEKQKVKCELHELDNIIYI